MIALAAGALVVFAAVAVFVDPLELLTTPESDPPANTRVADDNAAVTAFRVDGEDRHGRYMLGEDGERIYRDAQGRRYVIGPNGERWFIDDQGRRFILGPDGERIYIGDDGRRYTLGPDGRRRPLPGSPGDPASPGGEDLDGKEAIEEAGEEADEDEPAAAATLRGTVVDHFGAPYAGATIVARTVDGAEHRAASDDEGAFTLKDLPARTSMVVTARDQWQNTSKPLTTRLAEGTTTLPEALVLPRDTAIRGVVRDAETGLPVAGASVLLLGAGDTYGRRYTTETSLKTSPDGAFLFEKLTPRGYRLQIVRDGYAPRILNNVEPPRDLVVEMSPGAVITGSVRDTDGNPIVGAQINCDFRAEPAQNFHTSTRTDAAGFYAVKCQPESQHNRVSVVAPGYESSVKTLVKSGSENVDFTLAPSGNVVLTGKLLTMAGGPVTQARFFVHGDDGKRMSVIQSVGPDTEGVFRVEAEVAAVQLRVRSEGMSEARVDYTPVAGGEVDVGEIYMDAGFTVYGVLTERENPEVLIEGAEVRVGGIKVETGADGAYRIEGVPQEEFIVRVLHPAYLGTAQSITPQPGEHEIELNIQLTKANFKARVIVKEGGTLTPLEGVRITLVAYGIDALTDAEGFAQLEGLSAAAVEARLEKEGYATVTTSLEADVSQTVSEAPPQEVILPRGNAFDGTVTSGGEPLPGATKVEVWNESRLFVTVYTDSDGKYHTEALPLGQYYIGLPDYHWAPRPVELPEEGATFDIEVGPVCHLRGKLVRGNGAPHANAGVYIYRRDNTYWTATIHTGPDGEYEIQNLFPGEWVFCALKTQGDTAAQFAVPVNVQQAGWNDIDVQLPVNTGVITGRVTYPDGEPVKRARVAVTNLSANFERALLAAYVVTDEDGYYTAERLENGMEMQARVGGYRDDAQTATAFSEPMVIPAGNNPVQADIVVPREGVTVRVQMKRSDGGPIMSGGPLSYLYDSEGRLSGLYFGGSGYNGHIDIYDVPPGQYTLVVTNRGMKKATLNITVGTENIMSGLEINPGLEERSIE